jgi:radical SAM protein with 4Fe4S-binding SPASM domain
MPNLLQANLAQVWTRSFLREIADLKKKDLLAANPECGACEWFPECGVGCRASALTATGNLLAKDPAACELSRKGHKQRFLEIAASAPQAQ